MIGFAAPLALIGLLALPALWWLLRTRPPAPRREVFPPLALLFRLPQRRETAAKTPWWLLVLRLAAATLLVLAAAGPRLGGGNGLALGSGPVWIIIDNGWSAAPDWPARREMARAALATADAAGLTVRLIATAETGAEPATTTARDAETRLGGLAPRALLPDRAAVIARLKPLAAHAAPSDIVYIGEPVDRGDLAAFLADLTRLAPAARWHAGGLASPAPPLLTALAGDADGLEATIERIGDTPASGTLVAGDGHGAVIAESPFAFPAGSPTTTARFTLPVELRNAIARIAVKGAGSAASVRLVDDRWQRRRVGVISVDPGAEPLLAGAYYLQKALAPFADTLRPKAVTLDAAIDELLAAKVSVLAICDIGNLDDRAQARLTSFMAAGGVVLRFAGPHLAAKADRLLPAPLIRGDRALGGTLSWAAPQHLAGFGDDSPFAGLAIPADVTVARQVLAAPSGDLDRLTFARLIDGTPLVTAVPIGAGRLVLFHVTADPGWSNLPLSGLFVEMLHRITMLAVQPGTQTVMASPVALPLFSQLAGDGHLGAPDGPAASLSPGTAADAVPDAATPPGLYGRPDAFRALNTARPAMGLAHADPSLLPHAEPLAPGDSARPLGSDLLAAALVLLFLDGIALAVLHRRAVVPLAVTLFIIGLVAPGRVEAASPLDVPAKTIAAALTTRIAYVETGDSGIDTTTRLGLVTLGRFIARHTSLEPGYPVAVDPARDDLDVYPLIYWPLAAAGPPVAPQAVQRIDAYMRTGGTVLFDTRDGGSLDPANPTPENRRLRALLQNLDLPQLEPVPSNHVLTKSFYLLSSFPGRLADGPLWIEALPGRDSGTPNQDAVTGAGDGVTPILITGNDMAGAWAASDDDGTFLNPMQSGDEHQREMALRAGLNIVIYTLTGNYKSDQVHIPALLERLGK